MTKADSVDGIKVLFIVPGLDRAGAQTQAIDLINSLDSGTFDKTLAVFERNIDQLDRLDRDEVSFYHYIRAHKFDFSMVREIADLIERKNIEVIHCTLQLSLLVGWLAARLAKSSPKLVVALHTTVNVSVKDELLDRLFYRWLISRCVRVIFVCHAQAEYWKAKYSSLSSRAVVIHNGVDLNHFRRDPFQAQGMELRNTLSIPAGAAVLACIAGLRQEKGHRHLFEAFARLEGEPYLLLAGDGVLRSEMEGLVAKRGLSQRVCFLGNVADVRPVLAAADLSVLASTAVETFSIAMLESMAMEVPPIMTDIGGLAEAIMPGTTGDLVPIGDVTALKDTLQRYINDRERLKAMGKNARKRVGQMFSKETMAAETGILLREVCRAG